MKMFVLSFFRNCAGRQTKRFMNQCAKLAALYPHELHVIAVYGDCVDNTADALRVEALVHNLRLHLVEHNHGQGVFGSTEAPERMKALSGLSNAGLDKVCDLSQGNGKIFYVESDLIWNVNTIMRLCERLNLSVDADAIAPLVFAGEAFYDIWGYRGLDGTRFQPFPPYHPSLKEKGLTEVSSVGSCFVMEAWVLRDTRIKNDNALVGFWEAARANGYRIFVDAGEKVEHPA
jgi:hypothetical protein